MTLALAPALEHGLLTEIPADVMPSLEIVSRKAELIALEFEKGKRPQGILGTLAFSFDMADTLGENERIYPQALLAIEIARLKEKAKRGELYGRLDHPSVLPNQSVFEAFETKLEGAASRITDIDLSGKKVSVKMVVLDTPEGRVLRAAYRSGGNPGLSSRGIASWHLASEADQAQFADALKAADKPADFLFEIARWLRLYTFDHVTSPGYSRAKAKFDPATESQQQHKAPPMKITLDQIKLPENKDVYEALLAEGEAKGKAAAATEHQKALTAAVESARTASAAEAVKPLNEKITALEADVAKYKAACEGRVEDLKKIGLITDAQAESTATRDRDAALQKVKDLEAKLATATAAVEAEQAKNRTMQEAQDKAAALEAVRTSDKFKGSPFLERLLVAVGEAGCTTKEAALELATRREADFIAIANEAKRQTTPGYQPPNPTSGGKPGELTPENKMAIGVLTRR